MRRNTMIGMALVLTVGVTAPAFAQRGQAQRPARANAEMQQGRNAFGGLLRGIELTEEQRQRLEALRAQHRREDGIGNLERPARPDGARARADSARQRPDGVRPRPDSARQRPDDMRARRDSARQRPDGVRPRPGARQLPDSARVGQRPGRGGDRPGLRPMGQDSESIARAQEMREQTIADIRSVLTAEQRVQFEKNVKELQAREQERGRTMGGTRQRV